MALPIFGVKYLKQKKQVFAGLQRNTASIEEKVKKISTKIEKLKLRGK